jgi:hypothetical protein
MKGGKAAMQAAAEGNDTEMKKQNEEVEDEREEEEEEEAAEREGETEKGCGMKKSGELNTDDLEKSLAKLEQVAGSGDAPTRRDRLMDKARNDELSKSEREELFELLGGEPASASGCAGESIAKSMQENDTLAKAVDVSDYLQEQHNELVKSLQVVGEEIRKSDVRNHDFNLVMARAVNDIGQLVKSLAESVEALNQQPARAPKSAGLRTRSRDVLQKSFAAQSGSEDPLSKGEILAGLDGLMQKSMIAGNPGVAPHGEDITMAVAKYEQTHQLSRPMLDAIMGLRSDQTAAAH